MLSKEKVLGLIESLLIENEVFIISLDISTSNKIRLIIDSMKGVTIDDCVAFSRAIEHNLDREVEDFELEVASASLSEPFRIKEQYLKNIGKDVEVLKNSGEKLTGKLLTVDEEGFDIELTKKVKLEGKKKKQTITENLRFAFNDETKVRLVIKFK